MVKLSDGRLCRICGFHSLTILSCEDLVAQLNNRSKLTKT